MEELFRFEGLKVYQKSLGYIDFVHETTQTFPPFEQYELSRQFRRAAATRRKYMDEEVQSKSRARLIELSKMTSGLMNSLRNQQ